VFGSGGVVERVLGEEVRTGVVKVVEWIEAEPSAVLEAGSVACAVHHGGANSFLEAVQ
jgi:UDP:flavonoid glycosyltransferase YjiC (YdhE family)